MLIAMSLSATCQEDSAQSILYEADDLLYSGNYTDVLGYYDRAFALNQSNPDALLAKARVLSIMGRYDYAIECYDKAISLNSTNHDAWLGKARALSELGKYNTAIECYDEAIGLDPTDKYAWSEKGLAFLFIGRYDSALEVFDEMIERFPDDSYAWLLKSSVLTTMRRQEEAVELYDEIIRRFPEDPSALIGKGNALIAAGRHDEAAEVFDEAIRRFSNDENVLVEAARGLSDMGQYAESLLIIEEAIENNPEDEWLWNYKADILAQMGRYDDAIYAYDMAAVIEENGYEGQIQAAISKAQFLSKIGRYDEAMQICDEIIEGIVPESSNFRSVYGWMLKAQILADLGNYEDAIQTCDKALQLFPDDESLKESLLYLKGDALSRLGRYEEAMNTYEIIINEFPRKDPAWASKGSVLRRMDRQDEAIACFNESININPRESGYWISKGLALYEMKRYNDSLNCFNEAIRLDPRSSYVHNIKGLVLYNMGKYDEALDSYREALRINPKLVEAWTGKGRILQAINSPDEAMIAFAKVREFGTDDTKKALIYCVFLLCYALTVMAAYSISRNCSSFMILIMPLINLIGFCWTLSGLLDINFVLKFLAVGLAMIILAVFPLGFLSIPAVPLRLRIIWALWEFEQSHSIISWIIRVTGIVAISGYAIGASLIYFSYVIPSEQMVLNVLRLTLICMLAVNLIFTIPPVFGVMLSRNIGKDVRNIIFISQFGSFGINSLLLLLILWSYGLDGGDYRPIVETIPITTPPYFMGLLMSLFIVTILIPYFIGWRLSKSWNEQLLGKEKTWIDQLLMTFEFVTTTLYMQKLQEIVTELKKEEIAFQKTDSVVQCDGPEPSLKAVDYNPNPISLKSQWHNFLRIAFLNPKGISYAYHEARHLDPRFNYIDFIKTLGGDVSEFFGQFAGISPDEMAKRTEVYSKIYQAKIGGLDKALERERDFKPQLWIILGSLISTPIVAQAINQLAKWIATTFLQMPIETLPPIPLEELLRIL